DGILDPLVTGVQTCALPIYPRRKGEHWIFIQALDPSLCLCGANAGFRFIRSRSRTPMRRSDRAASLLSRKSQFTLQVLEADVFEIGRASCRERMWMCMVEEC